MQKHYSFGFRVAGVIASPVLTFDDPGKGGRMEEERKKGGGSKGFRSGVRGLYKYIYTTTCSVSTAVWHGQW